jgi:tRNA A37 methylthiotransferase MiaB
METEKKEVKRVYIDSMEYCEEARLDTQRLISLFETPGQEKSFAYTKNPYEADFLIYNACGHLQSKEDESIRDIKELLKLKKSSAKLIVWGCLPKINPVSLREVYDGPLVGPENALDFFRSYFNLSSIKKLDIQANTLNDHYIHKQGTSRQLTQRQKLTSIYNYFQHQFDRITNFEKIKAQKNTWYIKIVSGCLNNCTYCSDRLAYKSFKSQPVEGIMKQFELGLRKGYRDFFFVGRDLGSYGYDVGLTLPDLLDTIISKYPKIDFKIFLRHVSPNSLINMYPKLELLLSSKKIVYLGSHIQSGSTRILKLMGKSFSLSKWVETIRRIEKNYPSVFLETSIMVGFPSETEQDLEKSVNLINYLHFDRIVLYKYNERPNLPSLRIKNRIPEEVKDSRYYRMLNYVTAFKAREKIKPNEIFSFTALTSLFDLTLVSLRRFLRSCYGW